MLEHGLLTLSAIEDEDIKNMLPWFNDVNFLRNYDYEAAVPYTLKKLKTYMDSLEESPEHMVFAIKVDKKIIGIIGLYEILWNNGCATIFIGIGDPLNQGKGYGKIALTLLTDFAFNELNLHRLQLQVMSYNKKAINLYESFGFIKEGYFREFVHRNNERYDLILYSLLKREYLKE